MILTGPNVIYTEPVLPINKISTSFETPVNISMLLLHNYYAIGKFVFIECMQFSVFRILFRTYFLAAGIGHLSRAIASSFGLLASRGLADAHSKDVVALLRSEAKRCVIFGKMNPKRSETTKAGIKIEPKSKNGLCL